MNRPSDWPYWSVVMASFKSAFHWRSDWATHSRHIAKGSAMGIRGSVTRVALLGPDGAAAGVWLVGCLGLSAPSIACVRPAPVSACRWRGVELQCHPTDA